MSESKMTPGPWYVDGVNVVKDIGDGAHVIAVVADWSEETVSNARAIAAVPELIAAAQAAWNCIGELAPTQARVEVAQLLQAAIEKAIAERP